MPVNGVCVGMLCALLNPHKSTKASSGGWETWNTAFRVVENHRGRR